MGNKEFQYGVGNVNTSLELTTLKMSKVGDKTFGKLPKTSIGGAQPFNKQI